MSCFNPVKGYEREDGSFSFTNLRRDRAKGSMLVPCGNRCEGCLADRASAWADRAVLELRTSGGVGCFLTLTYDDEHKPEGFAFRYEDVQRFLKRVRRRRPCARVSFVACGEHGEQTLRQHYHLCVFGTDFDRTEVFGKGDSGSLVYLSAELSELWPYGNALVGDLTRESARYVAAYAVKRDAPRRAVDPVTGELVELPFPFLTCSNRPAIGLAALERWPADFLSGSIVRNDGSTGSLPRFFRKRLRASFPAEWSETQARMQRDGVERNAREMLSTTQSHEQRDAVKREVFLAKSRSLSRGAL